MQSLIIPAVLIVPKTVTRHPPFLSAPSVQASAFRPLESIDGLRVSSKLGTVEVDCDLWRLETVSGRAFQSGKNLDLLL